MHVTTVMTISQSIQQVWWVVWCCCCCIFLFHTNDNIGTSRVHAFSSGAGGCAGGGPAVGGIHSLGDKTITTPSFLEQNVVVTIFENNTVLPVDGTMDIEGTVTTKIVVTGTNMKGILFRISHPDPSYSTKNSILPGANTKITDRCQAPVVGITHTNGEQKSIMSGTLQFRGQVIQGIVLEITIVWFNRAEEASHSYGKFYFNVIAGPPMSAPTTGPPTLPPVRPPVICFDIISCRNAKE
jgi:hypothetical protein